MAVGRSSTSTPSARSPASCRTGSGPRASGPYGLLQTVADAIKLMFKEAIYPTGVDKKLFLIAPCLVVLGAFLAMVVIPFGERSQVADLNVGLFYVIAVSSLSTVGLIMAGWASNNKYALFGAMRSAAQIVSYEIPAVMILLGIVMIVGSLSLQDIVLYQEGGLTRWMLFRYFPHHAHRVRHLLHGGAGRVQPHPLRHPGGGERARGRVPHGVQRVLLRDVLHGRVHGDVRDLRGGLRAVPGRLLEPAAEPHPADIGPIGLGPFWLIAKAWFLVFVMMWLRWTLPRLRVDQLMHVAWKVLLPISMVLVVAVGGLLIVPATRDGFLWDRYVGWPLTLLVFGALVLWMVGARVSKKRRVQDLAA